MILQKIEIEQFGGLKDYTLEFSKGFQYLYGENEAGKSTICAFLSIMFYGMPAKVRKGGIRGDARTLYMPWGEKYMAGKVYFEAEGKNYILKRKFGKTAAGDHTELMLAEDWQEVSADPKTLGQRFLGVGADAFHKTLFIGQSGAAFSKGEQDELMDRLLSLEQSGDEDASLQKALVELEKAGHEIISKNTRGGAVAQLQAQIDKLEEERREVKQKHEAFRSVLDDIKKLTVLKEGAEKTLAALEEQKKKAAAYDEYCQREDKRRTCKSLRQRKEAEEKELAQVQEELAPLATEQAGFVGKFIPEQEKLVELAKKESQCSVLENREAERKALLEDITRLEQEIGKELPQKTNPAKVVMLILAAVTAFVAVWGGMTVSPVAFGFLLLSAVFVFVGLKKSNDPQAEQARTLLQMQLEEKKKQLEQLTREDSAGKLVSIRAELAAVFEHTGVDSVAALSAEAKRMQNIVDRVSDLKRDEARLTASLESLKASLGDLTLPPDEEPVLYDGPSVKEIELKLQQGREVQLERERTLAQMQTRVETGFSSSRSISVIETELEQARERMQELMARHKAIEIAFNTLQACSAELKNTFAPALNEKSSALISKLTKGRYRQIKVTDTYTMRLETPDGHDYVESDFVSAGTYDLLYFALRVSVLQTLFGDIPLLIMDDTFIQMDGVRQKEAFAVLQDPVAEQVLYFSCQKPQPELNINVQNLS